MHSDFINLRRMPSGRHRFCLAQMRARAARASLDTITGSIDAAIGVADGTAKLEFGWKVVRAGTSTARGDAALVDNDIDEQIAAIEKRLQSETVGADGDPIVALAEELLAAVFPEGVAAITHQSFEDQLITMDLMMEAFDGDFANHVTELGLTRHVERLRRLIARFRDELDGDDAPKVTFDQVKAARHKMHEATCKVVASVLHVLGGDDEQTVETRRHLLAPLRYQQERVAEAYRRQRHPTDVDPDTGEELLEDEDAPVEPTPEPVEA